jgi:hypothetical protein
MATRFATATGNWSNTGIWDGGTLPTSADTVYPNGFTVTIDTDITIDGLNNNIPPVYLPGMPIPKMTGNTQPSGICIAGTNPTNAFKAFDNTTANEWQGTAMVTWIGYTFASPKIIKRYYIRQSTSTNNIPDNWTFEGSNDGFATAGVVLDTFASGPAGPTTNYLSGIINPSNVAYTSYRVNVTRTRNVAAAYIAELEMTESTATTYGAVTGGSFTVPASLSGTRNIVQTGDGIKTNNTTIITVAATSGATVNFNIASGGFIFNQTAQRTALCTSQFINITGNCAVNFNANLWGNQTLGINYISNGNINIAAAATVTVNGNIYGGKAGFDGGNIDSVINTTVGGYTLTINGDVYGGTVTNFTHTIISRAIGIINITGNTYGDTSAAVFINNTSNVNIVGTVNLMNNNSIPAIQVSATSIQALITVNGYLVNKNNQMAIFANKIRFTQNTNPYWVFQNSAAADITLAYGAALGAYPAEADVKLGVAYAASPTRYGTCAVPLPQYVSQGVATGSTVGTAYINAADVWNVLSSSITTAGSIGERLKVASTVETTGDQLAAYIV